MASRETRVKPVTKANDYRKTASLQQDTHGVAAPSTTKGTGRDMTRAEKSRLWVETYNTAEKTFRRYGYQKTMEYLRSVPGISNRDAWWMLEQIMEG